MVILRCTQKLLCRMPRERGAAPSSSTTLLGDWYVNILFCRPQQLVLCVSERTLLSVVVAARPLATLGERLPAAVSELLSALAIDPLVIQAELREMAQFAYAPTESRSVLGSHQDLMHLLSVAIDDHPHESLLTRSLWLADTPCGPIGYSSPAKQTRELFAMAPVGGARLH